MKDCMMEYGCLFKGTGIPMQCDICPYNRNVVRKMDDKEGEQNV